MGEARRRGTYEQRKTLAEQRRIERTTPLLINHDREQQIDANQEQQAFLLSMLDIIDSVRKER